MRKTVATGVLVLGSLALGGAAHAATFDGMNPNPEFMTGITEVRAVTTAGTEVFIPVWSMPRCIDDGPQSDPCVWVGHQQGDMWGGSFVQVGYGANAERAYITSWAAEILPTDAYSSAVQNVPVGTPVPAAEPVEAVPTSGSAQDAYNRLTATPVADTLTTGNLPACEHEDSDNCYWNAETMGNGIGSSFTNVMGQLFYW